MCGCTCVGVCENQRNMVSFALIVYFVIALCFAVPLANLHL